MKLTYIISILFIGLTAAAVLPERALEEKKAVRIPNIFTLYST
jgi:hypothetical protein